MKKVKFRSNAIILSVILSLFCCCGELAAGNSSGDDILEAYQQMNLKEALRLTKKYPELPESKLVSALCDIHDSDCQDISSGLRKLKDIYSREGKFPAPLWREAALSLGRVSQLLKRRKGIYHQADKINFREIFRRLISGYPNSLPACQAAIYLAESYFDAPSLESRKEGFDILEKFIAGYHGPAHYLVPVHLSADINYIYLNRDYHKSVKHLKAAYKLGIANPRTSEQVLFRIGRLLDFRLHDYKGAYNYYRQFLKEYPNSRFGPVVKRYLRKLKK